MKRISRGKLFLVRLQRFFITTVIGGFVVVLPIAIFVVLVRFIFNFTTRLLAPIGELINFPSSSKEWIIPLISLGIVLAAFFLIGLVVRTNMGKRLFLLLEDYLLTPLPLYPTLRDTVQQFAGKKKVPFTQVVLVDVFNNDTLMSGFITDELPGEMYTVFVPTAPNPTNGFVFHVKKHQLQFVETRPEEAMRTIIGVGTGSSVFFQEEEKKPANN